MALRRREKRTERSKIDATPPWELRQRPEPEATTGPYDERDHPADDVTRVDLGALLVPVRDGMELRLEVNEAQQVVSVTLVGPDGTMQLGVFAAPRNEGIWDDVRAELATSIRSQRGKVSDRPDGPFGTELAGTMVSDGGTVPVRFLGVDGPRWFLRAMLVGPVASNAAKATAFEDLLRDVVVVRGTQPLPVREPVPLRMPAQPVEPGAAAED